MMMPYPNGVDISMWPSKLLDKHITEDTFGEEKLQDNATQSIPCGSRILGMHYYLRTIKILQATAFLLSWKGVAISAALMAVTVLMQILINFSKSEHSTAAQGCIRKGKECESGFRGNGQEDKTQ